MRLLQHVLLLSGVAPLGTLAHLANRQFDPFPSLPLPFPSPPRATPTPTPYAVQKPPLDTDWTYEVGTNPWPKYPRPQLVRHDGWKSLNGLWTWRSASGARELVAPPSGLLEREVLVPSCVESGLSGLQELDVEYMWYATNFRVPGGWGGRGTTLLNFEAVDYETRVFINGVEVGHNIGGYFRFTVDVTEHVSYDQDNLLTLFVHDPTNREGFLVPAGKQVLNPSHIFYRSCSGVWQSVWLEHAPDDYITALDVAADMDGKVTITAHSAGQANASVSVSVTESGGAEVGSHSAVADQSFSFNVDSPRLWWPDTPNLYNITVKLGNDSVTSYTGFRTVSRGVVQGVQRPLINGEFLFHFGTLDQGFWPDGLHTPPSYEAMVFDLKLLKRLGFNMVRKHIKIEPDLFYRACDEIGLMVYQDMPSFPVDRPQATNDQQAEFQRQLALMVTEHRSYPSIVTWIIYNEGWGQINDPPAEGPLTDMVRDLDPTRLVNSVTGWNDHGFGDYSDNHKYASPQCGTPFYSRPSSPHDSNRIGFQGEFGGVGLNTTIEHLWNVKQAIDQVDQTYEINKDKDSYNYRSHQLLTELRDQTERFECSGAVWTQTTDVEGEVNGLVTYDRREMHVDEEQWRADIQALYAAAASRGGKVGGGTGAGEFDAGRLMMQS
ncbi:hydrolase [Gaeumannomyces tritici R3-111a-1]|uniref:Hydrolase n=1 Tax=Gaeumannomyces tritici (strain R3-111a-1) TaxID=644352 RepID=J3NM95_GAET3|nr:hydrolase [Gaeumannomyces tritici R3-111a-1]EJT82426.1 hydrolase [Gaeumannomyces tritici R3-111a-1]